MKILMLFLLANLLVGTGLTIYFEIVDRPLASPYLYQHDNIWDSKESRKYIRRLERRHKTLMEDAGEDPGHPGWRV